MSGIKTFGDFWSHNPADEQVGDASIGGRVCTHDHITGGPVTQAQHLFVVDCAGYDYMKIVWEGYCLNYEGLAIDDTSVLSLATGSLVNLQMADVMRIAAAGMSCVDGAYELSLPKMFRLNVNDALGYNNYAGALNTDPGVTVTASSDLVTFTGPTTLVNGDIIRVQTSANGLLNTTRYYVINVSTTTVTTCQLSLTAGGAAVDITSNGTNTVTMPAKYPGSGRARPISQQWGATETLRNWEPDQWISGSEPLWVQWRAGRYGGDDEWRMYDSVCPALSWETSTYAGAYASPHGSPGVFQWGKVYKDAQDIIKAYKWTTAGDRFETCCWLGYPNRTFQGVAETSNQNMLNLGQPLLRITGLARVALTVGAIGLAWHGQGLVGGIVYDQDDHLDSNNASSYLVSTPVAPAVAPREHIRGRLWAVLIAD